MTAGGYKESYCEGYADQQSGDFSIISAGNNLLISVGSLTGTGYRKPAHSAATSATISGRAARPPSVLRYMAVPTRTWGARSTHRNRWAISRRRFKRRIFRSRPTA